MRLYWYRAGASGKNFGDRLGPLLLERFAGVRSVWASAADAEIITVGSIVTHLPPDRRWRGVVLGSGTIDSRESRDLSLAKVLAVRGRLTRSACKVPPRTPLGDPGILVADLFPDVVRKQTKGVAVLPHYADKALVRRHPNATRIDVLAEPRTIVEKIAAAKVLITSSLHGLIAADALGVPHVLEPHEAVIGGMWKFQDYASAFGDSIKPRVERLTDRRLMRERRAELVRIYLSLRGRYASG